MNFHQKAIVVLATCFAVVLPASAATLDRIKERGHLRLGYLEDARPFSFKGASGKPEGYSVTLCERIAAQAKAQLGVAELGIEWVPVSADDRLTQVEQGSIDMLCTPTSVTLERREKVSFSIPVFGGGVRAMMRLDATPALRKALAEKTPGATGAPVWRGQPAAKTLEQTTFGVVRGTTTESWLASRAKALQIPAKTVTVASYKAGIQALRDRDIDVFFGDRNVILGALHDTTAPDLFVFDRLFTQESYAIAVQRNDDDFRLLVDRTLSQIFTSAEFRDVYQLCCGEPDAAARTYFQWMTIK